MSGTREFDLPSIYQIRVKGHLDKKWSDWFDGFSITQVENEETLLVGTVTDQAALHGLLNKIRDLSLPLLSIRRQAGPEGEFIEEENIVDTI